MFRLGLLGLRSKQVARRKPHLEQGSDELPRASSPPLGSSVSEGISQQLLKWKGIEATEILAKSNKAKVIVIGGADGLPLILNTKN